MVFEEGAIYEGNISLSGDIGPRGRWIVVAPHGKFHLHSIDNPDKLRCWPIHPAIKGIEQGTLELVGHDPEHPAVQLQRVKEAHGIRDIHLGLDGEQLDLMLDLLAAAVESGAPYAPYVAAEIVACDCRVAHSKHEHDDVRLQVTASMQKWRERPQPG